MCSRQSAPRRRAQTIQRALDRPLVDASSLPRFTRRSVRYFAFTFVLLLTGAIVAACGGSSHKRASGVSNSKTNNAAPTIKPIATAEDVTDGTGGQPQKLRVSVYDLRRQGPFVVLDFGVACPTPAAGCDAQFAFARPSSSGDSIASGANAQEDSYSTAGGVTLLDPAANLQYQAVTDSHDHVDSSDVESINDSNLHMEWVKFPAPPSSVRSLSVLFPGGGPVVADVPITNSAAPSPAQVGPGTSAASPAQGAPSVDSTSTTGLKLPVQTLLSTVGNQTGSDAESPGHSTLSANTDVLFHFGRANLTPAAGTVIQNLAARIKASATGPVVVTGYTDSIGSDAVNKPLSRARARAVVAALRPLTPGVTYTASGKGSADPVAPNTKADGSDNPAGRRLNRRVTIAYPVKAAVSPTPPPAVSASAGPADPSNRQAATYRAPQPAGGFVDYNVAVNRLFRDGNYAVLQLGLTCERAVGQGNQCSGLDDFAGTDNAPPLPTAQVAPRTGSAGAGLDAAIATEQTASAFYLRDPSTGTVYAPLHQGQYGRLGQPITGQLPSVWQQGATYPVWIYFPAPPKSTTALQVVLPGGGTAINSVLGAASRSGT